MSTLVDIISVQILVTVRDHDSTTPLAPRVNAALVEFTEFNKGGEWPAGHLWSPVHDPDVILSWVNVGV